MKMLWVTALVGLSLAGAIDPASAQRGSRDYGSEEREYGGRGNGERDYGGRSRGSDDDDDRPRRSRSSDDDDRRRERGERGHSYDDDDRGRERGRGYQEDRGAEFDEDEYLRCHPDVRRAVNRGEMASGASHYKMFGLREGRRLTCASRP